MPNLNSVSNRSFRCFYAVTIAAVGLLIACFQWDSDSFGFLGPKSFPEPQMVGTPAMVERDIAPWDGDAFNVWIPLQKMGEGLVLGST